MYEEMESELIAIREREEEYELAWQPTNCCDVARVYGGDCAHTAGEDE